MACCVYSSTAGSTTSTTSTSPGSDRTRDVNWVKHKIREAEKFDGDATKLANWTCNVQQFCEVEGVTQPAEIVKMAVTLLTGKALTWWRSVANENWARLGICGW